METNTQNRWIYLPKKDDRFYAKDLIHKTQDAMVKKFYESATEISYLASMAEEEYWGHEKRILTGYLNQTFKRLVEEGKVLSYCNPDPVILIWHTGLLSRPTFGTIDIYCILVRNDVSAFNQNSPNPTSWSIAKFITMNRFAHTLDLKREISKQTNITDVKYRGVPEQLQRANYFAGAKCFSQFVFNADVPLNKYAINKSHLLDHPERFPAEIREADQEVLLDSIMSAIDVSIRKAKSNYRTAIPTFFRDKNAGGDGKLTLLLPITLHYGDKKLPQVAVAIEYICDDCLDDYNDNTTRAREYYIVKTLFTMEIAYKDARLLQKIEQDWLMTSVVPSNQGTHDTQQNTSTSIIKIQSNPHVESQNKNIYAEQEQQKENVQQLFVANVCNNASGDLWFKVGDTILLLDKDPNSGRVKGQNQQTQKFGWFPSNLINST
ncbi:guanine nucleotide exchange factor VAV2 [Acrasis kona]|uniref:Guanine nucleotide exchange factor VAV2 n=1 Tax=Acrasis kona TaxID=1008807 RepID=A0AAW2YLR0_9EUKA